MNNLTINQAARLLEEKDNILILPHCKPDGDTVGSSFALFYALKSVGKHTTVLCSDPLPNKYHYLYPDDLPLDLSPDFIVSVDTATMTLLGETAQKYPDIDLSIDHHPSNTGYAKNLLLDDKSAATAQLMEELINAMGISFSPVMANCIFTGLTTDTGCFRYSNVSAATHMSAARMINAGADAAKINHAMFESKTPTRIAVERGVMMSLEFFHGKRCATVTISEKLKNEAGATEEDLEGISAIPRQILGVDLGMTIIEKKPGIYRISMRSSDSINSSDICSAFGGGGHARAAGCIIEAKTAQTAREMLLSQIENMGIFA